MSMATVHKNIFLARIADQPHQYRYRISKRVMGRIREKCGQKLRDYLKFSSSRQPSLLEEWICAKADARELLNKVGDLKRALLITRYQVLQRQMPIDYALGWVSFGGLRLVVRPPILIPRPDTADWVIKLAHSLSLSKANEGFLRVLEVGTGTGCISILLFHLLRLARIQLQIVAIDISPTAVRLARLNFLANSSSFGDFSPPLSFNIYKCNVFDDEAVRSLGPFDLIISNPPYIPLGDWAGRVAPSVRRWESSRALIGGGKDGIIFHQRLLELATWLPASAGRPRLVMELDGTHRQYTCITSLATSMGFLQPSKTILDYSQRPRTICIY